MYSCESKGGAASIVASDAVGRGISRARVTQSWIKKVRTRLWSGGEDAAGWMAAFLFETGLQRYAGF